MVQQSSYLSYPKCSSNLAEQNFRSFEKNSAANFSVQHKPRDGTRRPDRIYGSKLGLAHK